MAYKYKFTCAAARIDTMGGSIGFAYVKSMQRPFEEIIEYDHEPSEDELEADYNDWLSRCLEREGK